MNTTLLTDTQRLATNPFVPWAITYQTAKPMCSVTASTCPAPMTPKRGTTFCPVEYVFYSASIDDLSTWTPKGANYRTSQDPAFKKGGPYFFAPAVVQGNDGRYYLYYGMSGEKGGVPRTHQPGRRYQARGQLCVPGLC